MNDRTCRNCPDQVEPCSCASCDSEKGLFLGWRHFSTRKHKAYTPFGQPRERTHVAYPAGSTQDGAS